METLFLHLNYAVPYIFISSIGKECRDFTSLLGIKEKEGKESQDENILEDETNYTRNTKKPNIALLSSSIIFYSEGQYSLTVKIIY